MKYLFWTLFLLAFATMLSMRIEEKQFEKTTGKQFNIMQFELPHGKSNLDSLLNSWNDVHHINFIISQLSIDYIFMSLLFPAILALCFWAREKLTIIRKKYHIAGRINLFINVLKYIGFAQLLAWLFDFCENARLEKWINQGATGNMFLFEEMVVVKFAIGIFGALIGIVSMIYFYILMKPLSEQANPQ